MRFTEFKNIPLVEGLTHKDPVERWIAVFKNSTHPKFAGKSLSQREKMARAAHYRAVQNNSMRYDKIKEGIRMGAKDLATPAKKDYTIGFEFEVSVDDNYTYDSKDNYSDDYELWEEFEEYWYQNNMFDFSEWFQNNYLTSSNQISQFLIDNDIEPRYGAATPEEIAEMKNRDEKIRIDRNVKNISDRISEEERKRIYDLITTKNARELIKNQDDLIFLVAMDQKKRFNPMSVERIKNKIEETLDKYGYDELLSVTKKYITLMKDYFIPKQYSPEDFEEEYEYAYIYDSKNNIEEIESITYTREFIEYFNVSESELRDITTDEWSQDQEIAMQDAFSNWVLSKKPSSNKIAFVADLIENEFNTTVKRKSSKDHWAVVEEATVGVDAEITSPALPIDQGIAAMKKVFDLIDQNPHVYTGKPTGLHINFGTFTEQDIARIDLLKFLMILNAERILIEFDRSSNIYTKDRMSEIIEALTNNDFATYLDNVRQNNAIIRSRSPKFSAINLSKLNNTDDKLIELRAPGNVGYEKKGAYLETTIRRVVRALELASDPNQYKKEYISMLYKRFEKENIKKKLKSKNPLEDYLFNTFNLQAFVIPNEIFKVILIGVIHGHKATDPNKGYTTEVHKNVTDLMKKFFAEYNDTEKIDMANRLLRQFDDILTGYDSSGKMKNSLMVKTAMNYLSKISKGQK